MTPDVDTDAEAGTVDTVSPAPHGAGWSRAATGLGAGLVATALAAGVLTATATPWVAVPWAVALVVLAPTARRLDRRLAVNLSLLLGLVPVALWLPPVFGDGTAAVAAIALGTGGAAAAVGAGLGRVVPITRPRDATIALVGALAAVVALPLRSPGTAERALAMLSTGIDNSYHYAMYLEQRLAAVGSPLLAAKADGTGFAFDDYPQWFHKTLTVLAQAAFGDPGSASLELVRYAQLEWLVFVLLAVLVTAAFLQALPERVDPSLITVAVAVLLSLLLGVPGGLNLLQGHLSFLVAASAPLVMFLLGVNRPRPGIGLFVVLGGLVLVTAAWLLLLPMAGAALVPPVVAVWRRQTAAVRWTAIAGASAASLAAFLLFVLGPLTHGGLDALLRDGTIPQVHPAVMALVLVGSVVLVAVLARRRRQVPLWGHLLMTAAALGQTAALGAYMLARSGELTYYFWKLGLGSLLVSTVVVTHAVVLVRTAGREDPHPGRVRPVAAGLVLLAAAVGLGGVLANFTAPSVLWAGVIPISLEQRPTSPDTGNVDVVLRLATTTAPRDAARTRLLATREQDMNPAHASEWFHALSHSSTRRASSVDDGVYDLALDRADIPLGVELAVGTLEKPDGVVLVTDPALYAAVLDAVPPGEADRVTLVEP